MSGPHAQLKYTGSTPGADSNTYVLFSTVAAGWPTRFFALAGVQKFVVRIKANAAFVLNFYTSNNGGTTWEQDGSDTAGALGATAGFYEYLVSNSPDWKLELVNGGTAQTTFTVTMALIDHRATP